MRKSLLLLLLFLVATSVSTHVAFGEDDTVDLDVSSSTLTEPLPFDVPFNVVGKAPPATFLVTLQYQEIGNKGYRPEPPLESGVNADGEFRVRLPALDPNREFAFHLTFDRRVPTTKASELRQAMASILEHEFRAVTTPEMSIEAAERVQQQLIDSLERAVNDGEPIAAKPGEAVVLAPNSLFDPNISAREFRDGLLRLAARLVSRQADREQEVRRYRETTTDFERELAQVSVSPELEAFLETLQRKPELDPRNPRTILFLSDTSRELLTLNDVELAAVARGQRLSDTPVRLEDTFRAEDVNAVRSRYLRTERALSELREWLWGLVDPRGANRVYVDRLLESRELSSGELEKLQVLVQTGGGPIHRAQRWAETLEGYAFGLEQFLVARQRALEDIATELEAQAAHAVVRQTLVTNTASTRANLYIGLDLGVLYTFDLERGALYFGANVYFGPVNKSASLRERGGLKRRVSITVGITVTDLGLEDDERIQPLLGSRSNLVLGVGYRLAKSMRVSGGAVLFLKDDPNPLVTQTSLTATPYAAFSFDADLVGALRALTR